MNPLALPQLAWEFRRYIAILALLAALWGLWQYRWHSGLVAGKAAVMALWEANKAEIAAVAKKQAQDNREKEIAAHARNEQIAAQHAEELAAAAGDRDRYARLLRQARIAAGAGGAETACTVPGAADASPPGSAEAVGSDTDRLAELDAAIAALMVEARENASQLDSLLGQLLPQL